MILTNNEDMLNKALLILFKEKQKVKRNRFKKWICMLGGIFFGSAMAPLCIRMMELIGFSFYNRSGLD